MTKVSSVTSSCHDKEEDKERQNQEGPRQRALHHYPYSYGGRHG